MESFKAELDALGIRDTPPVADVAKWKDIVPRLRGYMTNADLSGARAHRWIPMSREDLDDLTYMTSLRNQCDQPDREP